MENVRSTPEAPGIADPQDPETAANRNSHSSVEKRRPERLDTRYLDGLRGLAALYVVLFHGRFTLHETYNDAVSSGRIAGYSWFNRSLLKFFGVFKYGHAAVIFFFVLSGFVIHLRYARDLKKDGPSARFNAGKYFYRRARRIFPPLLMALLLTAGIDAVGIHLGSQFGYKDADHRVKTFFGNLLMVMEVYVPTFGTDGPVWSLKYEWWFYSLYPLFWWISRRSIAVAAGMMAILYAATLLGAWPPLLAHQIFSMMIIWWLGVLLADVYAGRIPVPFIALAPVVILLPIGIFKEQQNLLLGFGFAGLLALCFALEERGWRLNLLRRLSWLGDMSYTLYIIHLPLLVFAGGCLILYSPSHRLPESYIPCAVITTMVLLISWCLHLLVERPFTGHSAR